MVACKQLSDELAGDEWNLIILVGLSADDFWTWDKTDTMGHDKYPFINQDKCVDFKRELWFELVKFIWRNHRSVYQDHMMYICNDIVKPSIVNIFRYS